MRELIERQAALDALWELIRARHEWFSDSREQVKGIDAAICAIKDLPSAQPERKTGKWEEKEVIHKAEAETVIEEWQSCRCPVCGRYDTRPYMYYFDEPHFCSWCGADMRGEEDESD